MVSSLFSIARRTRPLKTAGSSSTAEARPAAPASKYVGGSENTLVHCALQVLSGQRPDWNPVVLWGVTGTGKSLLADLLSAEFAAAFASPHVIATTGADFARAYAHACDTDSISEFRQRWGRCQLLVIDDLHRLAEKDGAQQELVHLLDALARRGSLVLATMRHSPLATSDLLPMLASRLSGGLVVPLVPPAAPARREIIGELAAEQQATLAPAALDRLAAGHGAESTPYVTVPQLRHAIVELAQRSRQQNRPVDEELLGDLLAAEEPDPRTVMKQVAAAVGKHLQQPVAELRGDSRRQSVVQARNLAMYLCRELTGASYSAIGEYFGERDHTTVLHSCTKVRGQIHDNPALQKLVSDLATNLAAGDWRG